MQKLNIAVVVVCIMFMISIQSMVNTPLFAQDNEEEDVRIFNALYFGEERVSFIFDHDVNDDNPQGQGRVTDFRGNRYIYDQDTEVFNGLGYPNHRGIDYSLVYEPVLAAGSGTVTVAGWHHPNNHRMGFGLHVRIDHSRYDEETGELIGDEFEAIYAHLSTVTTKVNRFYGELFAQSKFNMARVIGISGNTGDVFDTDGDDCPFITNGNSVTCGSHLHFETRKNDDPIDMVGLELSMNLMDVKAKIYGSKATIQELLIPMSTRMEM